MNKLISSSVNENKLALTIKGVLMGLVPILVIVLSTLGLNIGSEEISEVITQITAIIAGAVALYGMGRKLYFLVKALFVK